MKKVYVLIPIIFCTCCTAKFSEKRFDKTEFFPSKKEVVKQVEISKEEEKVEMHFGPGPGDPVLPTPETSPKEEEKEKDSGWWFS